MKRTVRIIALMLAMACFFSVTAFADLQTGSEKFEGISRADKEQQKVREIYDTLIYRAYLFDSNIELPELEHMLSYNDIRIKYVQCKRGTVRGQSIYEAPYSGARDRWYVKDGAKVKVYARYNDYYFCEVMMNDWETEGTIGWIPVTYTVNKWNPKVSADRTKQYGG